MRITLSIFAALLLIAAPASAQNAPAPKPILTTIDRVPMGAAFKLANPFYFLPQESA